MKFWNKNKEIRQRCWTKISVPNARHSVSDAQLRRWCQLQDSTGKFYYYYGSDTWWFEKPEDAAWFALTWT